MPKVMSTLSITFFGFILWVIYLANTGQSSIFFKFVSSIPYGDKLGHFCLFGVLALGANFAFKLKSFRLAKLEIYVGSALVLSFAIIEELSQYYIPNRTFDFADLIADILGIATFHFATSFFHKMYEKKVTS
jgi:VanZ family protein